MTIKELEEKGSIIRVNVHRLPDPVKEYGDKRYDTIINKPLCNLKGMIGNDCSRNSICVVEAMHENGEDDWYVVPGFAFTPESGQYPLAHVWVRKGDMHYDPTWSLPLRKFNNWVIENLEYYQLLEPIDFTCGKSEEEDLQETNEYSNEMYYHSKNKNESEESDDAHRITEQGDKIKTTLENIAEEWNLQLNG